MKRKQHDLIRRPHNLPAKPYVTSTIFDRFFDILQHRASSIELPDFLIPQVDVHESQESITLEIEIPGMTLDDFAYRVEEDLIYIRGEKRRSTLQTEGGYTRSERRFGLFERILRLPAEVTQENSRTLYKDGILKIILPKKCDSEPEPIIP